MAQRPRDYASADYWGLDSLQAPVFGTDKPVLALAGPGSGKTRTIIAKAARLIEQNGWDTRSVALVTFTKAAAEEMRTRLQKAMPKNVTLSPRNTFIGTFHALSFRLLTAHWKKVGQINKVLTDYEASALVGQAANGFPAEKNSVPELMASIARYKSLPKGYEFTAVDRESDHFKIFLAYEEKRSKLNALEKNDLVRECLALIHQKVINPLPVAHLLSDETQDADFVQIDWILAHYAAGVVPTVVADDDQSIYAFRHAAGFAGLQRYATAVGAEILPMTFNYRSGKAIVDAAQGIVAASPNRFPKIIEAKRDSEGSLLALRYPSEADQAEWVVREAGDWLAANPGSSAAVISRTNVELDLIEIACKAQQIPYLRVGSSDFLQREHLQRTLLAVRLRINPEDAIGFAASAGVGVKISPAGMRQIQDYFNDVHGTGHVLDLAADATMIRSLIRDDRTALRTYNDLIADWLDTDVEDEEQLSAAINKLLSAFAAGKAEEWITKDIRLLATMLTKWVKGGLVKRLHLLESRTDQAKDKVGAITLCSGHASKGMEFDHVTIINADSEHWPYEQTESAIQEDRRLFYVAATRAMNHLTVCYPFQDKRNTSLSAFAKPVLTAISALTTVAPETINA